jgi:hypothetical protein
MTRVARARVGVMWPLAVAEALTLPVCGRVSLSP